ncbi:low-density lipoprotein receptor-related protein 2-like [Saccostrea cucullata]|uniref:low-density lipoprotein receptor-related protein 2-like n=1 Tax=Saccostrea cuccullata TaxID=36930 RepID=UPI002ED24B8F
MLVLHVLGVLIITTTSVDFSFGLTGNKGLVLGIWNPASLTSITEIPRNPASHFTNVSMTLNPSGAQIISISSDPERNIVFAAIGNSIYVFQNFTIWQNETIPISVAYRGRSIGNAQIAFDYVSKNLYWCDSLFSWIGMKPAYLDNTTIYKLIIHNNLKQPEGLALDPEDGLMFFSDNDVNPRIEKASMDGVNRTIIVHIGLIRVLSLSIDVINNLLYWADYGRHTLEASDYNGLNRKVLRRSNNVPATGLHFYQGMLHAASSGAKIIFGVDAASGTELYSLRLNTAQPYAVHVYDGETSRVYIDPCNITSCQHICVNTPAGAKCLCAEGYMLSSDGMTCTDRSWFHEKGLIVHNSTAFAMFEVQYLNGLQGRFPFITVPSSIIQTFTVDANRHLIYFVDSSRNELKELDIISLKTRMLTSIQLASDLNFDWITNLLGWIEPASSSIKAFSINSGTTSIIYVRLEQPTSLTVDPHNGDLYWISGTLGKSIMNGNWNRSSPRTIVSTANLNNPSSLYYDITSNQLYWIDDSIIKSSLTNGSDIKSHVITFGATQAFVYKGYFGWIVGNIMYFSSKFSNIAESYLEIGEKNKGVAVFDSSLQQDKRGSCGLLNGGCQDICVPLQTGRTCECDLGLLLQPDMKTCDSNVYRANFIVVADYSHGRILQIDMVTGNLVKLPINVRNSAGITFDKSTKELLHSDLSTKNIMSSSLHGGNKTLIYATGFVNADRLAIDYSTGNLYYTAVGPTSSQSYIGVIHRTTFQHNTLLSNLYSPREIVVYPSKGFLFWTEFGNITEIGRAYMDGSSKTYIATTDIGWPNGLAIDFTSDRIYWTDGQKNRIEFSDLNGGNRQVLTTDSDAHLMSIVIQGQYLYYTAWNRQRITKMHKTTGSKMPFMSNHPELGRLDSLAIYADDIIDVSTICSQKNGRCSTFCFPTPIGRTCGCEDFVNLQEDQTTCEGVSRCTTSLQNMNLLDCLPYPGQICDIECKAGYRLDVNTSITCDTFGQWNPSPSSLCTEILCPSSIENVALSSNCTRRVGDSCSFKCAEGFTSTSSQSLLCTSDGTWDHDTQNLCIHSGCPKTIRNGQLINCESKLGDTCRYDCSDPLKTNPAVPNVTCNANGYWDHDTNDLCVQLCSSTIRNGNLESDCQRKVGYSCSFTCVSGHQSTIPSSSIVCTADGLWGENINELCKQTSCPLEIRNGNLTSLCQGNVGEKCDVVCHEGFIMNSPHLFCTTEGLWDKRTDNICVQSSSRTSMSEDKTMAYIGMLAAGIVVIAIVIIATVCFLYRRKSQVIGQEYQSAPAARNNIYATFKNGGYMTDSRDLPERPVSDVYCSIDDAFDTEYDEPLKDTYLNPLTY